jgi:hypothetical protein
VEDVKDFYPEDFDPVDEGQPCPQCGGVIDRHQQIGTRMCRGACFRCGTKYIILLNQIN